MRAAMRLRGLWVALAFAGSLGAQAPASLAGLYLGLDLGHVNLRIPGRSLEMEGISFTEVQARADNAGFKAFGGVWVTPNLGVEFGAASLGHADATFAYAVPPSETGTGVTQVQVSNGTLCFLPALRAGRWCGFLRVGVQFWTLRYETTFRPSGGGTQYRLLEQRGNSAVIGAGLEYHLRGNWLLRLEGEALKMDITEARVFGLGLTYRFP